MQQSEELQDIPIEELYKVGVMDFITLIRDKVKHCEVVEIPNNAFLAVYVENANGEEMAEVAESFQAVLQDLDNPPPIVVLPEGYTLQVYEGASYVRNRTKE